MINMRIHLIADDDSLIDLLPEEIKEKHTVHYHKLLSFKTGIRDLTLDQKIQTGDMLICYGRVGQLGMALQEIRPMNVIGICVPVEGPDYEVQPMRLCHPGCQRTIFFSSNDLTSKGQWSDDLCDQYFDLPFIGHDVRAHIPILSRLVTAVLNGEDVAKLYRDLV